MKEIFEKTGVDPRDFCQNFPSFQTQARGAESIVKPLENSKYQDSLRSTLTPDQINYVRELLVCLSKKYSNSSYIRNAILKGEMFKPKKKSVEIDETTEADLIILRRIFTPRPIVAGHEKPFWHV